MFYPILCERSVYIGKGTLFSQTLYMEAFFPLTGQAPALEAKPIVHGPRGFLMTC